MIAPASARRHIAEARRLLAIAYRDAARLPATDWLPLVFGAQRELAVLPNQRAWADAKGIALDAIAETTTAGGSHASKG